MRTGYDTVNTESLSDFVKVEPGEREFAHKAQIREPISAVNNVSDFVECAGQTRRGTGPVQEMEKGKQTWTSEYESNNRNNGVDFRVRKETMQTAAESKRTWRSTEGQKALKELEKMLKEMNVHTKRKTRC